MQTFTLYIGSNNETNELEKEKIERIVAARHDGFTIQEATGYWLGKRENSAVVSITDEADKILATITELKSELHQEAIAYQQAPTMKFA